MFHNVEGDDSCDNAAIDGSKAEVTVTVTVNRSDLYRQIEAIFTTREEEIFFNMYCLLVNSTMYLLYFTGGCGILNYIPLRSWH